MCLVHHIHSKMWIKWTEVTDNRSKWYGMKEIYMWKKNTGDLFLFRPTEENACTSREVGDGPMAKRHAGDKKSLDKKKKEKKKVLKRLWCQPLMDSSSSFSTLWTNPLVHQCRDIEGYNTSPFSHFTFIHVWLFIILGGSKHLCWGWNDSPVCVLGIVTAG